MCSGRQTSRIGPSGRDRVAGLNARETLTWRDRRDMYGDLYNEPVPQNDMFTLAHLSDPHISPLPRAELSGLLGKRILGLLSWKLRRRKIHEGPVLGVLAQDIAAAAPDHIAITGDLVNISLPREFENAVAWLQCLGLPKDVTVVPGNHDAYVRMPWRTSLGLWSEFMAGSSPGGGPTEHPVGSNADFPFVRIRGEVALVGVSTACPMPANSAGGIIGQTQLDALALRLDELGHQGLFRVILIHHPPHDSTRHRRKRLIDSAGFRQIVARHGAELVLHGHTHQSGLMKLPTPQGHAPVISVPSASAKLKHGKKGRSQYHIYRIGRNGDGWRLEVEIRGIVAALDRFEIEGRFSLAVPH
jgi:Calcineurin-like phosphoesterase